MLYTARPATPTRALRWVGAGARSATAGRGWLASPTCAGCCDLPAKLCCSASRAARWAPQGIMTTDVTCSSVYLRSSFWLRHENGRRLHGGGAMEAPPPPPGGGGAGGGGAGKGDGDENGVCCCALACWILWRHGDAIPLSLPPPCSVSLALFTNLTQALSGTFLRCASAWTCSVL